MWLKTFARRNKPAQNIGRAVPRGGYILADKLDIGRVHQDIIANAGRILDY